MASMAQSFNPSLGGMPGGAGPGSQPMVQHPSNQSMPGAGPAGHMGGTPGRGIPGSMPQVNAAGQMIGMVPGGVTQGLPPGHPNAHAKQHLNPNTPHNQNPMFQQMNSSSDMQRRQTLILQQQQAQLQQQRMLQQQQFPQHAGAIGGNNMGQAFYPPGAAGVRTNMPGNMQQPGHATTQQQVYAMQQQQSMHLRQQQQQQQAMAHQQAQHQNAQNAHQQQQQQQAQQQQVQQQQRVILAQQQAALAAGQNPGLQHPGGGTPQLNGLDAQAAREHAQQQQKQEHARQAAQQHVNKQQMAHNPLAQQIQQQRNQQQQAQQAQQAQHFHNQHALQQRHVQQQHAIKQQNANYYRLQQAQAYQAQFQAQNRTSCVALLRELGDRISNAYELSRTKDLKYWQELVRTFFADEGIYSQQFWSSECGGKTWQLSHASLPRFFHLHFLSGVRQLQLHFEHVGDDRVSAVDGSRLIECRKVSLIYTFDNGHQLFMNGDLRAQFNRMDTIDVLDIVINDHAEYVPRSLLLEAASQSPDAKQSPNISKAQLKRQQQQQKHAAAAGKSQAAQVSVPRSVVNEYGLTKAVLQFLELADIMIIMSDVFRISHERGGKIPAKDALQICNNQLQQQSQQSQQQALQQQHQQQQQQQQPQANPGMLAQMQAQQAFPGGQIGSPAMGMRDMHAGIGQIGISGPLAHPPGSMGHPQAVNMAHQLSQGGNNSSNAAAPAALGGMAMGSPNIGMNQSLVGKRRRPSGVVDEDVNGSSFNGVAASMAVGPNKVKQSPRVGAKKTKPAG